MDPGAGTVVVVRLAGEHLGAGEAELLEVDETSCRRPVRGAALPGK
ncbi:MAG: hypothetical protein OXQ94_03430 [Gemmatimonadota bacterium]|nr:hypothetical protein [Gemmatimonadota bacterium]MDE2870731.1 hypothetical protein [Gemmatimonadota bacterium]